MTDETYESPAETEAEHAAKYAELLEQHTGEPTVLVTSEETEATEAEEADSPE